MDVVTEPDSPVFRPNRGNIMSISAMLSGPTPPARVKSPSPTPPPPSPLQPPMSLSTSMGPNGLHGPLSSLHPDEAPLDPLAVWTQDDEAATEILQALVAHVDKPDTSQLDRLIQIIQLAALDIPLTSQETNAEGSDSQSARVEAIAADDDSDTPAQAGEPFSKYDPFVLNPLDTLDVQRMYDNEETEYLQEQENSKELYDSARYLAYYDQVVDDWRAGELARLRLHFECRRAEIGRIWSCDRKFAWSNYIDARAGPLYRETAKRLDRQKWQARMELDLLGVHRRQTRNLARLLKDLWLPADCVAESEESKRTSDLYARFGSFVAGAKHAGTRDPLLRDDLLKMRLARKKQHARGADAVAKSRSDTAAAASMDVDAVDAEGSVDAGGGTGAADVVTMDVDVDGAHEGFSSEGDSEYDSDYSSSSDDSGISSLPSFSSVCASPITPSVDEDGEMEDGLEGGDGSGSALDEALATSLVRAEDGGLDSDEDESLWARQMRLQDLTSANHSSGGASGLMTPLETPLQNVSRAVSPSAVATRPKPQTSRKRKRSKKPPPPGARLWKHGQVQRDPVPAPPAPASAPAPAPAAAMSDASATRPESKMQPTAAPPAMQAEMFSQPPSHEPYAQQNGPKQPPRPLSPQHLQQLQQLQLQQQQQQQQQLQQAYAYPPYTGGTYHPSYPPHAQGYPDRHT
ncbi:hypothetical protein BCV70DRAFT_101875 [Testicularia cyperi]|uniref:Uncharacterized protein n=1 Tax=Testicularia cyperi TaxID=1882483 RepID=A0A317XI14_9BASI|nr:hypothetical protein BCV70DRAFT_101875 [Testicularia cyperi]